jgi:hypothetical protein
MTTASMRRLHCHYQTQFRLLAARFARGLHEHSPSKKEGAGNAGCALHPRSRVQSAQRKTHTSIQVQRRHPGIPCAMALRLIPRSPRRRIRLVTVAAGLMALPIRSDRNRHRQLGTSNGCRDHTVLPYAATRLRQERRRRVLAPFILRAVVRSRENSPCEHTRADAAASTASLPTFVTTRDRPSCRARTGRAGSADLPDGESEYCPSGCFAAVSRLRRKSDLYRPASRSWQWGLP